MCLARSWRAAQIKELQHCLMETVWLNPLTFRYKRGAFFGLRRTGRKSHLKRLKAMIPLLIYMIFPATAQSEGLRLEVQITIQCGRWTVSALRSNQIERVIS